MPEHSLKYHAIKGAAKLFGAKRKLKISADGICEKYGKKSRVIYVPDKTFSPELTFEMKNENLYVFSLIRHRQKREDAIMFIPGGGMFSYPDGWDYKFFEELALRTGRDVIIPYYPLCLYGSIDMSLDMIYWLFQRLIAEYGVENVAVAGCSVGGNLALGLVSHINAKNEGVPMPERLYVSSPMMCIYSQEERERAMQLDKTDPFIPAEWLDTFRDLITHGKELPDYMLYPQLGIYDGLDRAHVCFADCEVLYSMCGSLVSRLESAGAEVTLEVGKGLFHGYPVKNNVREAHDGHINMLRYLV